MRAWILLLLVAPALAGCTEPGGTDLEPQDAEPEGGPEPTPEPEPGTEPGDGEPGGAPPTATLTADVTTGDAPLEVTFTLDGSDPDGDDLAWTFDADGDGTADEEGDELPATVVHTFGAGNHTARLVVSDGEDEADATLRVESVEPAPAAPAGPVQEETVSWAVGGDGTGAQAEEALEACGGGPADGATYATFTVDALSHGRPFTASVAMEYGSEAFLGWYVGFYDASCGELLVALVMDAGDLQDVVPAGATTAFVSSLGGVSITATYTAG